MNKSKRIEDARERLNAAESRLKEFDYAGVMYEAPKMYRVPAFANI